MSSRVAIVTGANKGIGLAIVRNLALQYPSSPLAAGPLTIYLTARDKSRGEAALKSLQNDASLAQAKALESQGGRTKIELASLDISKNESIQGFVKELKEKHGKVDFVVNNAGIALEGFDSNVVEKTLATNYYGTLEATQSFLSIIRDDGRLVNVASMSGHLHKFSPEIQQHFLNSKTLDDVHNLAEDFKAAVAEGKEKEKGFVSAAYATSKALEIAMTRVIASEWKQKGSKVLINACCPGYVSTDMTKGRGSKTPDQGAQTPVMLALQDVNGVTGEFWQNEKIIEW